MVFEVFRGLQPGDPPDALPVSVRRFACRSCGHLFDEGDGGDTHTYCPAHLALLRGQALELQP